MVVSASCSVAQEGLEVGTPDLGRTWVEEASISVADQEEGSISSIVLYTVECTYVCMYTVHMYIRTCEPNCPVALIKVGWSLKLGNILGWGLREASGGRVTDSDDSWECMKEWQRSLFCMSFMCTSSGCSTGTVCAGKKASTYCTYIHTCIRTHLHTFICTYVRT